MPEANSNLPLISVVTIVRNNATQIEKTIASVLSQTYPKLEYLIVDGESTDGTIEIIRRFESQITKWISEPDSGISDAFNKGTKLATGDSVLFMNAGDRFTSPESLTQFVANLPQGFDFRNAVVYGEAIIDFPDGQQRQKTDHEKIRSTPECTVCHQSALIGITLQKQIPYDVRLRTKMDLDFWLRCLANETKFYKVDLPISRYLAGGITSSPQHAVMNIVERGVVKLLNGTSKPSTKTIALILADAMIASARLHVRRLFGRKGYLLIKRVARRPLLNTP